MRNSARGCGTAIFFVYRYNKNVLLLFRVRRFYFTENITKPGFRILPDNFSFEKSREVPNLPKGLKISENTSEKKNFNLENQIIARWQIEYQLLVFFATNQIDPNFQFDISDMTN